MREHTEGPFSKGGLVTSPDLQPGGHQVAPHWAKGWRNG